MAGESEWTLVTGLWHTTPSQYKYDGQTMPNAKALRWLEDNLPRDRWRLKFTKHETERTECGLIITWAGDFLGYEFKHLGDAMYFKVACAGNV